MVNVDLFTIHTMVNVSWIHLQKEFIDKESLEAANSVLGLVRQLSDGDYSYLDPALSVRSFKPFQIVFSVHQPLDFRHVGPAWRRCIYPC